MGCQFFGVLAGVSVIMSAGVMTEGVDWGVSFWGGCWMGVNALFVILVCCYCVRRYVAISDVSHVYMCTLLW